MVVLYNRLDLTKRMLNSLFETTDSPFRLIIIDNNSTDGTKDFIFSGWIDEQCRINPYYVENAFYFQDNKENKGIAIGRNQALNIANQYNDPYLCTIDNDVEFNPGWLSQCLDILSTNPKFCVGVNYEEHSFPIRTRNGKTFALKPQGNLGTATMVFPRELHEKIGFFIKEYGLYSCEDSDWGFRSRRVGYEMAYLPDNGKHIGTGESDTGEYREFKDKAHKEISVRFKKSCHEYLLGKRSLYIPFD